MSRDGVNLETLTLAGLRVERDANGNAISFAFLEQEQIAQSESARVLISLAPEKEPSAGSAPKEKTGKGKGKEKEKEKGEEENDEKDEEQEKQKGKGEEKEKEKEKETMKVKEELPPLKAPTPSRIQWGKVNSFYFADAVGYGVVPSRGFYPLGMGAEEEVRRSSLTVDEAEQRQQELLLQRAQLCGLCTPPPTPGAGQQSAAGSAPGPDPVSVFETRQFDYKKKGVANPLFAPLSEEERLLRLLSQVSEEKEPTPHPHPPPASPGRKSKRRSGSVTDFQEREDEERRASRSASVDFDTTLGLDQDMSVAALNKELRAIRLSRAVTTGCSCKPLKVDKLSVAKLREELTRGAGADEFAGLAALGKSELVSALRDKLKDCALCRDNNCICVQEGIECRSDTCECLRHGARGGHKSCENPHGVSVFDSAVVQEYRKMFLSMHDVVPS